MSVAVGVSRAFRRQKHGKAASGTWPRSLPFCSFPTPLPEGRTVGQLGREAFFPLAAARLLGCCFS